MNTCNRQKKKTSREQIRRGSEDRLQDGTCTRTPVDRKIKVKEISKIKQEKQTYLSLKGCQKEWKPHMGRSSSFNASRNKPSFLKNSLLKTPKD